MEFRNTKTCNLSQELKRQHAEREKAEAKLERQRRNQMRKQLKRINQQQKAVKRAQSTIYRASTYGKGKRRRCSPYEDHSSACQGCRERTYRIETERRWHQQDRV